MAPRIFRKMGISSCSSTKFHYGKRVLKQCASVVPAVIFFRELVCQSKCFIVRNDARKYISLLLLQNNISLKLFWLRGEKLNYKSVSKDAERRMIHQRFPAELYAGRGRASNMAGKSNL